jgi:hypothetical protein
MPGEIQVHGNQGLRAKISEDGAIHDCKGVLIGFINEDGSAGDSYVSPSPFMFLAFDFDSSLSFLAIFMKMIAVTRRGIVWKAQEILFDFGFPYLALLPQTDLLDDLSFLFLMNYCF